MKSFQKIKRLLPLMLLILALLMFFLFHLDRYLSFETLRSHRTLLLAWTQTHYLWAVICYMAIYIMAVAISIPGAVFFTLIGGFLFGIFWGTLYVLISATLGATLLFLAVQTALGEWLSKSATNWIVRMQRGFQQNAFQYLLVLRFIPIFPFWAVNIVPALLGVRSRVFITATFIGIMPGSIVYVMLGNGLGHIFNKKETPELNIIFEPQIFLPLVGLAFLALLPVIYKFVKGKQHD